jgi:hypothetical protein
VSLLSRIFSHISLLIQNRIKTSDVAKLQDEYAKLVEGLQESITDQNDTDGFMGNPCMYFATP